MTTALLLGGLFQPKTQAILGTAYVVSPTDTCVCAMSHVFKIGCSVYAAGYRIDPKMRAPGFGISMLSYLGMVGVSVYGALQVLGFI